MSFSYYTWPQLLLEASKPDRFVLHYDMYQGFEIGICQEACWWNVLRTQQCRLQVSVPQLVPSRKSLLQACSEVHLIGNSRFNVKLMIIYNNHDHHHRHHCHHHFHHDHFSIHSFFIINILLYFLWVKSLILLLWPRSKLLSEFRNETCRPQSSKHSLFQEG